ncbi:MAG: hypothetical protein B6D36_00165 [Planctomycetes bacterium UTPLA1]|nr:MAG: hypothetical protein B6D36_00165 [Planctomycetes bacterium UTPLA1]
MYAEDLDTFFETSDFAEVALNGSTPINGLFDNGYGASFDVAGSTPSFTCKSSDATGLNPGTSTLTIRSSSWLVVGVEADGTGVTVLRLQEAA